METSAEPSAGEGREQQETMIAFFDVETTVPFGSGSSGGGYSLLEFGAILVCPRRLVEVESFSTLIRPSDLNAISSISIRCNGITRDTVATAPYFVDVADRVFSFLNGKVWAGHNILRFDCARIREAFAEIGRPPPEPNGTVDTLPLLTQRFGRRAGDMKMATLARYFGLGQQKHRSLDDVRMNLEVLKYCATVLFLESSVSNVPPVKSLVAGNTVTESNGNQNDITVGTNLKFRSQTDPVSNLQSPWDKKLRKANHNPGQSDTLPNEDAAFLTAQVEQMNINSSQLDYRTFVGGNSATCSAANLADSSAYIGTNTSSEFLEPDDVLVECITLSHTSHSRNLRRTHILHQNLPLQFCCRGLVVHFGISNKFLDHAGRPKLSILVNAPEKLCQVLGICDSLVQSSFRNYGSTSDWRPLIKKNVFSNSSSMRLHIPTISDGDTAICSTEIYQREALGTMNKIIFSRFDAAKIDLLLAPGTTIDAFFSLDSYDYQQNAGNRLVAKCLVVHSSVIHGCCLKERSPCGYLHAVLY